MFQMQEISVACKSASQKWELHSQDTGPPWQGRVAAAACLGDPTGSARTVLTLWGCCGVDEKSMFVSMIHLLK